MAEDGKMEFGNIHSSLTCQFFRSHISLPSMWLFLMSAGKICSNNYHAFSVSGDLGRRIVFSTVIKVVLFAN